MLAIAYGDDQRDAMQIHYPEVCYPAQGFSLIGKERETLATDKANYSSYPQFLTNLGRRNEPVTYWTIRWRTKYSRGGIQKKLVEIVIWL